MAVREIRIFGDPVLRTVCAPIEEIDDGVRALVADLVDTVELPGRAGVAAPQIGVALRAFSYNIDGDIGYVLNPVLTEVRGEPEPTGRAASRFPACGTTRSAIHGHAWRESTSTATRWSSKARASSPRLCSTRPITWTASSS